jgi:hypothetical protein
MEVHMDHARRRTRAGTIIFFTALAGLGVLDIDWSGANGDGGCGCDAAITSAMILLG